MKKRARRLYTARFNVFTIVIFVFLILYIISLAIPILWGVMTSLKDKWDFMDNAFGLPKVWTFANFIETFNNFYVRTTTKDGAYITKMGGMYLYSLLYSLGCAITSTIVPCTTAYLCVKFPFKFSRVIYTTVIVTMVLPIVGSLPSQVEMAKLFGLHNQIFGLWIMSANFLGLYFLVFYASFKNVPDAYSEAAEIDGASNFTIYVRIMMPMIRSAIFTIMLIRFIGCWNDYQTPLIFMPVYPTVAYGVWQFNFATDNELSSVPMKLSGAILLLAPVLTVFLIFHKRLMGNVTVGGLKG